MLNKSRICLLAFTTSSRHPRVLAETCNVTTAPSPELSIIGTSFKSSTMRPFLPQASRISSFSSGTFSEVNLPKHSTTQPSSTSRRCTRNPLAELAPSFPGISTLRPRATPRQLRLGLYLISPALPSAPRAWFCRGGVYPALLGCPRVRTGDLEVAQNSCGTDTAAPSRGVCGMIPGCALPSQRLR